MPGERGHASVAAVDRALAWYLAEAPAAKELPVPLERARLLRAALDGGAGGSAELFDWFVSFGSVMVRMALVSPGVPSCNVGDTLTTLMSLPSTGDEPRWPFDPGVDRETFAKLGFEDTSRGIAASQRNNREGWRTHAEHCRVLIEEAARLSTRKELAVVLGVGHAFDVPLATLAGAFDRLVLVDVDRAPVDAAVERLRGETAARAQIDVRAMDLTGINRAMVTALDEIVAGPGEADEIQARIEACCRSYHLRDAPTFLELDEHADLVVSSCLVSQLPWPQRRYAHEALVKRFGALSDAAERRWRAAWASFELRVQQDHINSLADNAEIRVLISDTVNHLTAFDGAGAERLTGERIHPLGVESLVERVPRAMRVDRRASWPWPRHRPSPRGDRGSLMEVEGLVLR